MERREAPRSLRNLLRLALRSASRTRQASGTQVFGGWWGSRGARALARSPGASRRSIAARVVGGRTLLLHPASRSTAPSTSQGEASVRRM